MLIYRKSELELEQEALERLSNTGLTNTHDGSRALSLVKAMNTMIQRFYNDLDRNIDASHLSKAQGGFLDLIGELVNCKRRPGENNDNYRYRISNQVYVVAGGNKKSIEIETSEIPNVRKVILKNYTRGVGSFSAYVITSSIDQIGEAIDEVQRILDNNASFGIKGVAESPRILPVSISMNLVFSSGAAESSKRSIILEARRKVKSEIDKLDMGSPLIISQLFQEIRNVSPYIFDVVVNRITVGSRSILVSNYTPHWDEKLFVESIEDIEIL